MVKNLSASAGNVRDSGSISGSGRSLGGVHGNPLQYACWENAMDRGAWWAASRRVTKSHNGSKLGMHAGMVIPYLIFWNTCTPVADSC